ncbi:MAG TPA: hypothetical protein VH475_28105 [Tepidisphaeraceae bacterium]|jgi:anti-sigma factor RsiW
MSSQLHKLENNEAILLMYLAGELPDADRIEVEQMLVNDPGMRIALADLTALEADVSGVLNRADASLVLSRRESAVRRFSRAMAALDAQRRAVSEAQDVAAAASAGRRFRLAWWTYPIAAAALLVVGIMVFSGRTPMTLRPAPENQQPPQFAFSPVPQIFVDASSDPALERLDQAEREVLSLRVQDVGFFDADSSSAAPDSDR